MQFRYSVVIVTDPGLTLWWTDLHSGVKTKSYTAFPQAKYIIGLPLEFDLKITNEVFKIDPLQQNLADQTLTISQRI